MPDVDPTLLEDDLEDNEDELEEDIDIESIGGGGRKLPSIKTIGVLAAAVLLGTASGGLGLGPRLASGESSSGHDAEEAAHEEDGGGHGGAHGGGGHGGGSGEIEILALDNIVVNPAGTDGMRFVMVSFGLKVDDLAASEALLERELEVRDVVSSLLERQSIGMLTSPNARDSLRVMVAGVVAPFLPEGVGVQVFVPQFLIQ